MNTASIFLIVILTTTSLAQNNADLNFIGPPAGSVNRSSMAISHDARYLYTSTVFYGGFFKNVLSSKNISPLFTNISGSSFQDITLFKNDSTTILTQAHTISLRTTDAGDFWDPFNIQFGSGNFVPNPLNDSVVLMVRNYKELWRSDDRGASWFNFYNFNNSIKSLAISKEDTSYWFCGADNYLYKSTDAGITWEPKLNIAPLQIIIHPDNRNSLYLNYGDSICISKDGGSSIKQILYHPVHDFVVAYPDTSTIYTVNTRTLSAVGNVLKTTNEGMSWFSLKENFPVQPFGAISVVMNPFSNENIFVGLSNLGVFETTDGGDSWKHTRLSYSPVLSLHAYPGKPGKILAGTYGWGFLKTDDFGFNWDYPQFFEIFQDLAFVHVSFNPFDSSSALAASGFTLFKTTDGGNSWTNVGNILGETYTVAYHPRIPNLLFSSSRELPYRWPVYYHKSTDNGQSWEFKDSLWLFDFIFHPTEDSVIYADAQTAALKSTDLGESWNEKNNGLGDLINHPIKSIAMENSNPEILFCGQWPSINIPGYLNMTTNGGDSWFRIDSSLKLLDKWCTVTDILTDDRHPGRLYVSLQQYSNPLSEGYSNGGLFLTENYGKSWRKVFDHAVNLIASDDQNPRNIYISTNFGIAQFLDTLIVTSVKNEENKLPEEYFLSQNYPNPFNPVTRIKFSIPSSGITHIKIYDILGKEIKSLLNEYKTAGTYQIEFDAGNLTSGVYFYKLINGSFAETKKMLLLR